jgi:hypothetical protein
MKVYTHSKPQIVLVVNETTAAFEYVRPNECTITTVRRAIKTLKRGDGDTYIRTTSLETPPLVTAPKHPPPPQLPKPKICDGRKI